MNPKSIVKTGAKQISLKGFKVSDKKPAGASKRITSDEYKNKAEDINNEAPINAMKGLYRIDLRPWRLPSDAVTHILGKRAAVMGCVIVT